MSEFKRYSKSIRRARAAMQSVHMECELCDRGNETKWKCETCEELMCEQCKVIHLRSRIANRHQVSPLTRYSKKERQNRDPLQCSIHPKERIHLYCNDCDALVCSDCIINLHLKHSLQKIAKIGAEGRTKIKPCLTNGTSKMEDYKKVISQIQKNQKDYRTSVEEMIAKVQKHGEKIKCEVDKQIFELTKQLEDKQTMDILKMKLAENQLKKELGILKEWINKSEEDVGIIRHFEDIQQNLNNVKPCPEQDPVDPPVITYGNVNLTDLIGRMDEDAEMNVTSDFEEICPDIHLRVLSTFVPKIPASHVSTVNGKAWFRYYSKGDLQLVTPDGKVVSSVTSNYRIHDIATNKACDLLLTVLGGHEIYKLTKDGKFEIAYNMSPYSTFGLCTTETDAILVCVANEKDQTSIVRVNEDKEIVQKISTQADSKTDLFDSPMFVAQSRNGNICVINYDDNESFSVLILSSNGHLINTYTGPTGIKMDHNFTAWYLQTDYYNNILVSDTGNSCVHILNRFGNFTQFLFTSKNKLGSPGGMSIDSTGKLWVCTDTQTQQADSSKVHVIQYLVYQTTNL